VGWNGDSGTVSDSYATGTVTRSSGTSTYFGGFVGSNHQAEIYNCYSTGSVHYEGATDPTDKGFAGIVGTGGDYLMTGNFWDTTTSKQSSTAGTASGKTTAQMMDFNTFNTAGWDIVIIGSYVNESWYIDHGSDYPRLGWQHP